MRLLKVNQPWASMIAHGDKEIEVRSRNTNIREKIAIYATKTPPSSKDMEYVRNFFERDLQKKVPDYLMNLPTGRILATATLRKSVPFTPKMWKEERLWHMAPEVFFEEGHTFGWYLEDVVKLDSPRVCNLKKGTVVWDRTELQL
ncbi:MAG: ASCH domain-containing protein [Methanococcoides sp.]|nr:ASCH domain-containing protein [Methanococcoides sp.]